MNTNLKKEYFFIIKFYVKLKSIALCEKESYSEKLVSNDYKNILFKQKTDYSRIIWMFLGYLNVKRRKKLNLLFT